MGKIRDKYFHSLIPDYYLGIGENGNFGVKMQTSNIPEAMPFDDIKVTMSITELYQGGFDLYFEFFKVNNDGPDEKLAYGEHKAAWSVSDEQGNVKQIPLHDKIMNHLKKGHRRADNSVRRLILAPNLLYFSRFVKRAGYLG